MENHLYQKTNGKSCISKDQYRIIYIKRPMENHLYQKTNIKSFISKDQWKSYI